MKVNNNNKNGSNAKKIIPAVGMLSVSAVMLASSTFAWFTMSREVEVNNIKMTASVPEDLQISLGQLTSIKSAGANPNESEIAIKSNNYVGLQGNQGVLLKADGATNADDGQVKAPVNDGGAVDNLFWSNTADISEYYRLGKIIPASSIDGEDIFFTPDASGVGTTLKADAKFYQVASLASADFSTIYKWKETALAYTTDGTGDEARTKLHAITAVDASTDKWNLSGVEGDAGNDYDSADAWNDTNDDGYYVDIPIWIRSSAKDDTTLSVDAYVTTNAAKTNDGSAVADDELYLAARAVIIHGTTADSTNLLRIRKDSFTSTDSIIDYMYSTNNTGDAVKAVANYAPTYDNAVQYNGAAVLSVPGRNEATTDKYGTMVKAVVRVWLEGEDPNCWNPNAGQDFNISLKFVKGAIGHTASEGADEVAKNANGVAYPAAWDPTAAANAHANSNMAVDASTVVTITAPSNSGTDTLEFTFNGLSGSEAKWNLTDGSFEILDGWSYKIGVTGKTVTNNNVSVTSTDDIATWLLTNVTNKDIVEGTFAITGTDTHAQQGS